MQELTEFFMEMQAFVQILGNEEKAYQWLMEGEMEIRKKFCR